MGWSDPVSRQGLDFPCLVTSEAEGIRLTPRSGAAVFTDLDLYLMGLLPPEGVREQVIFSDQNLNTLLGGCNGRRFSGSFQRVNISTLLNALGKRVPDFRESKKHFRIATVVVSKDRLLPPEAMRFYSFFARRAEQVDELPVHSGFSKEIGKPFRISTQGKGSLDTRLTDASGLLLERAHFAQFANGQNFVLDCLDESVGRGDGRRHTPAL